METVEENADVRKIPLGERVSLIRSDRHVVSLINI